MLTVKNRALMESNFIVFETFRSNVQLRQKQAKHEGE